MPGNFDDPLPINAGQIAPSGPLDPKDGHQAGANRRVIDAGQIELFAWVVQPQKQPGGVGAFMGSRGEPDPNNANRWRTVAGSANHKGQFQPGKARGIAVQVWTGMNAAGVNETRVSWWDETINLQ
jgi:hypothetical protein